MNPQIVGRTISERRKKLNMTQAQLAERLNVSNKSISRWETGTTMPDISLLIPLSEILEISLNDLLDGETEDTVREDLLKDTIQLSADQVEKHKNINRKLIMNLAVAGLLVFILTPWYIVPKSTVSLSILDPPGFYVLLAEMAGYCLVINLLDQKDRMVSLLSYAPLVLNACILVRDLLRIIRTMASVAETRITLMPVISCVYVCAMTVLHYVLFTKSRQKTERGKATKRLVNPENGHLILFCLAVATIMFVAFVPAINYSGVSHRTLLESFVETRPKWYGNVKNKDNYQGVILKYGFVSLLLCPILCIWAKLRNRIIFVLTNLSLLHILASIINYPIRFKELLQSWLTVEYVITCLLPIITLLLLYTTYFKQTFISVEKEKLTRTDQVIQLIYLIFTVTVFSYVFMAVPFGPHLLDNLGEWYLMMFMTALTIVTSIHMLTRRVKEKKND